MNQNDDFDYSLEYLHKTFLKHAEKAKESFQRDIIRFQLNNPERALPERLQCHFNISEALAHICKEILTLKKDYKLDE